MPLFIASYTPLSFSEINEIGYWLCNVWSIAIVLSFELPSTTITSMLPYDCFTTLSIACSIVLAALNAGMIMDTVFEFGVVNQLCFFIKIASACNTALLAGE